MLVRGGAGAVGMKGFCGDEGEGDREGARLMCIPGLGGAVDGLLRW